MLADSSAIDDSDWLRNVRSVASHDLFFALVNSGEETVDVYSQIVNALKFGWVKPVQMTS